MQRAGRALQIILHKFERILLGPCSSFCIVNLHKILSGQIYPFQQQLAELVPQSNV